MKHKIIDMLTNQVHSNKLQWLLDLYGMHLRGLRFNWSVSLAVLACLNLEKILKTLSTEGVLQKACYPAHPVISFNIIPTSKGKQTNPIAHLSSKQFRGSRNLEFLWLHLLMQHAECHHHQVHTDFKTTVISSHKETKHGCNPACLTPAFNTN